MESVLVLGNAGFQVPVAEAHTLVYGYACGLGDRAHGRTVLTEGELALSVNGQQGGRVSSFMHTGFVSMHCKQCCTSGSQCYDDSLSPSCRFASSAECGWRRQP